MSKITLDNISENLKNYIDSKSGVSDEEVINIVETNITGDKTELVTNIKDNLVNAINENANNYIYMKQSLVDVLNANGKDCTINDNWTVLFEYLFSINNSGSGGGSGNTPVAGINGEWVTATSLGNPRKGVSLSVVDGKIYAIGGINNNGKLSNNCNCFDPSTNRWTTLTPRPVVVANVSSVVVGTKIYTLGGTTTLDSYAMDNGVYVYDTVNDSWESITVSGSPNANLLRNGAYYVEFENTIYSLTNTTIARFIIDTKAWNNNSITNSVTLSQCAATCYYNNRMYIIGGGGYNGENMYDTLYMYDISSNTMTQLSNLPLPLSGAVAEAYNGFIYVFGGVTSDNETLLNNLSSVAYVYDINADTWQNIDAKKLPTSRVWADSCLIDNHIYVIGGSQSDNQELCSSDFPAPVGTNEMYTIE